MLQVSLELGGKNAAVVFDDADLEAAVAGVTRWVGGLVGLVMLMEMMMELILMMMMMIMMPSFLPGRLS